jgi:L-ascorbate metabolism protein UlaG (beta-lactamase superfamily)
MIITYHGKACVKLQTGDTVIALGPIAKSSQFKTSGFGADIALIPIRSEDYGGTDMVTYDDKVPFVINGPGEYEKNGLAVRGFKTAGMKDGEPAVNTSYLFEFDSMVVAYLGAMSEKEIPENLRAEGENIDIVIVPIGGKTVLGPEDAYKVARTLSPKLIIPVDYGKDQEGNALKQFLSVAGKHPEPTDKLTIKLKDLSGKDGEVAVITS